MQTNRNSPEVLAQILSPKFQARFWKWVDRKGPDECWPWAGNLRRNYGQMKVTVKGAKFCFSTHRLSWIIHHQAFPPSEQPQILHSCIACPTCCNPNHLRAGTPQENMDDKVMQDRGNWAWGEKASNAKLSESDVIEIRKLLALGYMHKTIAVMFGVGRKAITKINMNQRWKKLISA